MEVLPFLVCISLVLLGIIPASIARHKGRAVLPWWIYGSLLFVVALPHAVLLHDATQDAEPDKHQKEKKQCSYCMEWLPWEDDICPYCRLHLYEPKLDGPEYGMRGNG